VVLLILLLLLISKDGEESASDSEFSRTKKLSFEEKVATVEENPNEDENDFSTPPRRGVGFADAGEENEVDGPHEQVCHVRLMSQPLYTLWSHVISVTTLSRHYNVTPQ
jgi:hypothetical protein